MKLRIFTNEVAGGWLANDVEQFLGGSEEHMVLLSEAFVKYGYDVFVYHTFPPDFKNQKYEFRGVDYVRRDKPEVNKGDILITFKEKLPWIGGENDAAIKIHFSMDVETPWDTSNLDDFVCLTPHHYSRITFVPEEKKKIIGCGIDMESLDKNQTERQMNSILYCSSPDRGLFQLLNDWKQIKTRYPEMVLNISYGFKNIELMGGRSGLNLKQTLLRMMKQDGINYLGELSKNEIEKQFWKNQYWILPLSNPDSELFCLNAVKSSYCGCIPIVNKIGALRDTVYDYIPYMEFIKGNTELITDPRKERIFYSWDDMVEVFWQPLFEEIEKSKTL